ncbi:MAG TPA: AmmeMemoRadiSam system radical SAM enzyme [Planctomycetota bacterium]|nr:AmmeMemoRadiSam system radical SAM enzyme [Planctomycetota bacterium]
MHQSLWFAQLDSKKVHCQLCPHNCIIHNGQVGICRQRKNANGILYSLNYGQVVSMNLDPIEKKPLYHFYPGEKILSIGTNGCNLSCQFCQNWSISQEDSLAEDIAPDKIIKSANRYNTRFIAYTYNEPFIWYEYVLETAKAAKKHGLINVLVTNGYVNPEPFKELLPYISAMNVDVKSINNDFYRGLCKAKLEPVLETIKIARGITHIEITNLVITGENDKADEFEELAKWVAENLGRDTPLHFSAYFPSYKLDNPPTQAETLLKAYQIARKYLCFVYLGNVAGVKEGRDTDCCKCGVKLIERVGYQINISGFMDSGKCKNCGSENNIKL